MQTPQRVWRYLSQHRTASIVIGHVCVLTALGGLLLANALGLNILGVFASSPCSSGDATYSVVSGDTLGTIAARYNTSWQNLASYNHLANPNLIYIHQTVCIPGRGGSGSRSPLVSSGPAPVRGGGNLFSYPQCTWWANQRYFQLHGVYVPWTTQSDAWQWTARALDFHWHVSSTPSVGAIVDLQPWVQGAYGLGHVAVVERVLGNGHVIASNLNWGANPTTVAYVEFVPGPGVSFISI